MRNQSKKITFPFARTKDGIPITVNSLPLSVFLNGLTKLNPKFAIDQIFKDVFTNRVPVPEDLPLEEQQQRIKAQLMLQDLIMGIFGSMELKGGVK